MMGAATLAGAGDPARGAVGQAGAGRRNLSLTGFLAQTAVIHKIASEIMVEEINGRNGFLGRPVEYVLLDDQSKPEVARSLYEKLITVDKVDLIQGPYATAPILAAMGVAQRYGKVMIQSSMGIPSCRPTTAPFPATPFGSGAGRHLSQRDPRRDGDLPEPAQVDGDPDLEVPVGPVHGARHEGAGREARREGAALSRIRIGQPRLRRDRRAHQGSQRRLPVGRLARAREQPAARGAAQARIHAEEPLPSLSRRPGRWRCRRTATRRCARPSSSPTSRS
jgi:hypothetical protein